MKSIFLISFLLFSSIAIVISRPWNDYQMKYMKKFKNKEEENRRHLKFLEISEQIDNINEDFKQGKSKFYTGHNHLSTILPEEVRNYTGILSVKDVAEEKLMKRDVNLSVGFKWRDWPNAPIYYRFYYNSRIRVRPEIDYRVNWTRPTEDQGACGSCWAFAVAASIDANMFIKSQTTIVSSQQELIDCSGYFGTLGCNGGQVWDAFDYIILNNVAQASLYPYTGTQGVCSNTQTSSPRYTIKGYVAIAGSASSRELALREAVAKYGTCIVYMQAAGSFFNYQGGLYDGLVNGVLECSSDPFQINHAMVVVGYGSNSTFGDYWIVRNSWGPSWGVNGHVFMKRNVRLCAIGHWSNCPVITDY